MNKGVIKNLAFILLLAITIFSIVRYAGELKVSSRLQDSLTQIQSEIAVLTQEKQNLLQALGKEKELNKQLAAKDVKLKAHLKASKVRLTLLFRDNSKIQNNLEDANAKLAVLKAENKALIDTHSKKPAASSQQAGGNQGLLVKDSRLTSGKIKIEVIPDPGKSSPQVYPEPVKTKEQ